MSALLEVRDLCKHFHIKPKGMRDKAASLKAVDQVSFDVLESETLGVVGESGCGKSTLGKTMLRLHEKTSGSVKFDGVDLYSLNPRELKETRRHMQMIFQDPFSSLNPRKRISDIIAQPLKLFNFGSRAEVAAKVESLMEEVGLNPRYKNRYPHQFSGGQRQRVGIARAIALQPKFIVCDESVSALDVSIQAQIINLLKDLQQRYQLTYLFIAHDLSVVDFISDRIMVMYLGRCVEMAPKAQLVENPLHPYTQSLFAASPGIDPRQRDNQEIILGDVPSPIDPPRGCHFHPRCKRAMDVCRNEYPEEHNVNGSLVRCHLYAN